MTTPSSHSNPISDAERNSLGILYQVTATEIAFFKQQQWTVMNYAVGLHAALIAISQHPATKPLTVAVGWALVFLACAIPTVAALALARLRNSIEARRLRLAQTRGLLGQVFKQAWEVPKEADDFYFLFTGILVGTWLVSIFLAWPRG